jgi:hypothetical protein
MRRGMLFIYCLVTNYRFRKLLAEGLRPYDHNLDIDVIRTKAGASLTSVSTFLGFVVAVIAWLATQEFSTLSELLKKEEALHHLIWCTALAFVLHYSGFWLERYISAVSVETTDHVQRSKMRRWRSLLLIVLSRVGAPFSLGTCILAFVCIQICLFAGRPHYDRPLRGLLGIRA